MSSFHGHFVWHELQTPEPDAVQDYYAKVVGWVAQDAGVAGMRYTRFMVGDTPVAGLMTLPPAAAASGACPGWTGYVGVDDVDAMVGRLEQARGSVFQAPMDIPGIGRFAAVADPQGAAFALFQPLTTDSPGPLPMGTPGTIGWNELHAGEWTAAFPFYAALFGWEKGDTVDMGPMGVYQLFTVGGIAVGGMMTKMAADQRPTWRYYFNVADIHAALGRATAEGGQVITPPQPVPGGMWITHCTDPQGVFFALVGPPQ